jgi:hypothetical protein
VLAAARAILSITPENTLRRTPGPPIDSQSLTALARVLRTARSAPSDPTTWSEQQDWWTATALGKIAPGTPQADQAVAALMKALESRTTHVATIPVIKALARFRPPVHGAIPWLRELQQSPNIVVRQSAAEALAIIEDPE